jgi:hypothetical protein
MGKKGTRGRGVIAIALFQQAKALERWAAAQERIAASNERLRDQAEQALELQRRDVTMRTEELPVFRERMVELDELLTTLRTAIESPVPVFKPASPSRDLFTTTYLQADRGALFFGAGGAIKPHVIQARKSARILAIVSMLPFVVETDRGPMTGVAGDYIVTNHPDDDPGSDLWTISAERFESTYRVVSPICGQSMPIAIDWPLNIQDVASRLVCTERPGHTTEHLYRYHEAPDADA